MQPYSYEQSIMNKLLKINILALIILLPFASQAQEKIEFFDINEAWQGSLSIGVNSFWGDVNDYTNKILPTTPFQSSFYQQRCFVLGGFFGKRLTSYWNINIEFKLSNLAGKNYKTAMQFYSHMNNEIVFTTTVDILELCKVYSPWSLYPRIGVGVYGFKSRVWNTQTGVTINAYPVRVTGTETPNPTSPTHMQYAFAIPFGVGVGYRILPELNIFFETSMTWVNSDYLDAYSSSSRKFEGVWTSSIGVSYQFDFPVIRSHATKGGYNAYDPALKKDNTEAEYKRMQEKSSVIHKPVKSHSKSAVKTKKAKRKQFSM